MPLEILRKEPLAVSPTIMPSSFEEPYVRWSGIFCGAFITSGLSFLFMLVGATIGLPSIVSINPLVPELLGTDTATDNQMMWTWIFTLLTQVVAFAIGGYCSARMSKTRSVNMGSLYGLSSWAVVVTFFIFVTSSISPFIEQLLAGNFPASSRWLILGIFALGALFSIAGGSAGRVSQRFDSSMTENEPRIKTAS